MAHTTRRAAAATFLSVALAVGLAGCSSSDSGEDATTAPADAATTAAEPTEEPTQEATEEETPEEGKGDASSDFLDRFQQGIASIETAAMSLVMSSSLGDITSTGVVNYSTDPTSMAQTMDMMGITVEMRMVDGVTYMNMGDLTQGKWVTGSAEEFGLDDSVSGDPLAQMKDFGNALVNVVEVGQEDLDGVSTTRYVLTLDTSKLSGADAGLPDTLDYDIWLDGEGRPVQMVVTMDVEGTSFVATTTMSAFNEPVTVEAPAPDQITTMPGMNG